MGGARWIVGCALLLSSCLQVEETITLRGDGGGTVDLELSMSATTLADARRAVNANQGAVAGDPSALFVEAAVQRELEAAGLSLVAHRAGDIDGGRKVTLQASFPGPAALRQSPLSGSAAQWRFTPGPVPGTVEVSFFPQGEAAWIEARRRAEAMDTAPDPVAQEFFSRRRAQLAGLDVTVRLRLPGKVLRYTANLEQTGECEVTARVTQDQIQTPEDLVRRLAPRYQVVFDASGAEHFPIDP